MTTPPKDPIDYTAPINQSSLNAVSNINNTVPEYAKSLLSSKGMNSSYLSNYVTNGNGRTRTKIGIFEKLEGAAVAIGLVAFLIVFAALALNHYQYIYLIEYPLILEGLIITAIGIMMFSKLQRIENLPVSKIDGASDTLNEIQGMIVPESGDALISPMTKTRCVGYTIKIQKQASKNSKQNPWVTIASYYNYVPTLITDGSGYLAFDFSGLRYNNFYLSKSFNAMSNGDSVVWGSNECNKLLEYINTNPSLIDLSPIGIEAAPYKSFMLSAGAPIIIKEDVVPTDMECFAIGRTIDTGKRLNDKPVKEMVYDQASDTLSLQIGTKTKEVATKMMSTIAVIIIGLAVFGSGTYMLLHANHGAASSYSLGTTTISTIQQQAATSQTMPCESLLHVESSGAQQLYCGGVGLGLYGLSEQQSGTYTADIEVYTNGTEYGISSADNSYFTVHASHGQIINVSVGAIYPSNQSAYLTIGAR